MSDVKMMTPEEQAEAARQRAVAAELAVLDLRKQLVEEQARPIDERLDRALELISHFKTIIRHSVANLHPEYIRDLPAEAFEHAAALLSESADQIDKEISGVLAYYAKEIYDWRDKRKARGVDPVPAATVTAVAVCKPKKNRNPLKWLLKRLLAWLDK